MVKKLAMIKESLHASKDRYLARVFRHEGIIPSKKLSEKSATLK